MVVVRCHTRSRLGRGKARTTIKISWKARAFVAVDAVALGFGVGAVGELLGPPEIVKDSALLVHQEWWLLLFTTDVGTSQN